MSEVYKDGLNSLWLWFGLSRASWLTLPRVMMHEMPDEWQKQMAVLLDEYDKTFQNQPDLGTRVQVTSKGKMVKTPGWLNYRHPDSEYLNKFR